MVKEDSSIIRVQRYVSPCGELLLGAWEGQLCLCKWQGGSQTATVAESNLPGGIIGHYPGSRPAIGRVFQGGTAGI